MLPDFPVRARQRKAGLLLGVMASCGFAAHVLLTGPPPKVGTLVALACVALGNAAVVFVGWPDTDGFLIRVRGRRSANRGGGRSANRSGVGHGLDADAGPAPTAAGGPPMMRAAARLMPPAAGRRWLAEAESVLFELPAGWRGKAVRSYLRSAPRLAMLMWLRWLTSRTGRRV